MNENISIYSGKKLRKLIYDKNVPILPVDPEFWFYDPQGNAVIEAGVVTIDAENGMNYDLDPVDLADQDVGQFYKIEWRYTYDGKDYYVQDLVDLVAVTWDHTEWNSEDLFQRAQYLRSITEGFSGKAESGTINTIVDKKLIGKTKYPIKGSEIQITEGTNEGKVRTVKDYAGDTITVDQDYADPIDGTSRYLVKKTYTQEIEQATLDVQADLLAKGIRPMLLLDGAQVKELVMLRAARDICFGMIEQADDVWQYRYEKLNERYGAMLTKGSLAYDANEDETIQGEEASVITSVRAVR